MGAKHVERDGEGRTVLWARLECDVGDCAVGMWTVIACLKPTG